MSQSAEQLKTQGNALHQAGNYSEAYKKYTKAIAEAPDEQLLAILYANRAATCLQLNKYLDALGDAQTATMHNPAYTKAWARVATAAEALRYWHTAQNALNKQLETVLTSDGSERTRVQQNLSRVEANVQRVEESLDDLDQPWRKASQLLQAGQLARNPVPSSGWVIGSAAKAFVEGWQIVHNLQVSNAGYGYVRTDYVVQGLASVSNGITADQRAARFDPQFISKLPMQIQQEVNNRRAWNAPPASSDVVKQGIRSHVAESMAWQQLRPMISVTVHRWIIEAFIENERGTAGVAADYGHIVEFLRWGANEFTDVPKEDRGMVFEPTFIRAVVCLRVRAMIKAYERNGVSGGYSLDEIMQVVSGARSETEGNMPPQADLDLYAPFGLYPRAEAISWFGWVHAQRGTESDDPATRTCTKEFETAAEYYVQAATVYPEDEQYRVFHLLSALKLLWRINAPLSRIFPVCRQIKDCLPQVDKIWGFAMADLATEEKDVDCRRAVAFLAKCEEDVKSGKASLDDFKVPAWAMVI